MIIIFLIYIIYKLNERNLNRYKVIKYLKVFINIKSVLVFIVAAIISNFYLLYLDSKYEFFYKYSPDEIEVEAIVVRRLHRKRI